MSDFFDFELDDPFCWFLTVLIFILFSVATVNIVKETYANYIEYKHLVAYNELLREYTFDQYKNERTYLIQLEEYKDEIAKLKALLKESGVSYER